MPEKDFQEQPRRSEDHMFETYEEIAFVNVLVIAMPSCSENEQWVNCYQLRMQKIIKI